MAWFVYLIECKDGSIYTGIAVDVGARYAVHKSGKGVAIRARIRRGAARGHRVRRSINRVQGQYGSSACPRATSALGGRMVR